MWPYIRPEIKRTYVDPSILDQVLATTYKNRLFALHEIGYTSQTKPKRIIMHDAGSHNPYHLFFFMIARFYYFDNGEEIVYNFENEGNYYLVESALRCLPKRFKREENKDPNYEYIEMPGCLWLVEGIQEPWIFSYVRDLYQDLWKDVPQEKGKYIYISRNKKDISNRRVLNEDELLLPLKRLGFNTYNLDLLTFEQQIKLFRSSEVITGLYGAGLSWVFFCFPGTKIIQIESPDSIPQVDLPFMGVHCGLSYTIFQEIQPVKQEDFPSLELTKGDCLVNKEKYLAYLQTIINQTSSPYQNCASA